MARITVEDCLENVDNRFELVLAAAQRARQLSLGAEPRVARENDKDTVIALREIAAGLVTRDVLNEEDYSVELQEENDMAELVEGLNEAAAAAADASSASPDKPATGS